MFPIQCFEQGEDGKNTKNWKFLGHYCRRVPEVNISVTKLMFLFEVSTQEV